MQVHAHMHTCLHTRWGRQTCVFATQVSSYIFCLAQCHVMSDLKTEAGPPILDNSRAVMWAQKAAELLREGISSGESTGISEEIVPHVPRPTNLL